MRRLLRGLHSSGRSTRNGVAFALQQSSIGHHWRRPLSSSSRVLLASVKYEDDLYDEVGDGEGDGTEERGRKGGKLRLKDVKAGTLTEAQRQEKESDRLSDERELQTQGVAVRATMIGAGVNLVLAIGKGGIGYLVSSTGLMADGANHLGDLLCDAVVWYTVVESRKSATVERPWGMGKLEPLGALTVGGLLMATGMGIGSSAGLAAYEMFTLPATLALTPPDAPFALSHELLQNSALLISGLSIVGKELLFRYTIAAGTKANSAVVVANAWQHRSDAIVSSAVFAGLVGTMVGTPLLDPLAGLLVSGVIVKQALTTTVSSLKDLSDMPADKSETDRLTETCLRVPGIKSVETLRARQSGPFLYVECTVGVEGTISASAAHRLAELARKEMMRTHRGRVANAVVDVEPLGSTGLGEKTPLWARDHDSVAREVSKALGPIMDPTGITGVSEVQVYYRDDGSLSVSADVRMSPDLTIRAAHALAVKARIQIEKALPGVAEVDIDLELDEGYVPSTTHVHVHGQSQSQGQVELAPPLKK